MVKSKLMKQRSTTPVSRQGIVTKSVLVAAAVMMVVAAPLATMPTARADRYDDQINALKQEIGQYQAEAQRLAGEADTLQKELSKLSGEKAVIQGQIDISEAKFAQLQQQIKDTEKKIVDNQDALGETIADLYVDDTITPLEMLASSQNIGDYVDKQTYRSSIQDTLSETIETIKKLKKDLEKQKVDVERVLADQKSQREALAAKENERQSLLDQTKGQEAAYQQIAGAKSAEVQKLQEQQAAAIRARASGGGNFQQLPGDPNKGGYPANWANAPMNAYVDNWGMYTRQCVSYAAFKVDQAYGNMPYWGGRGNANQWGSNARAAGFKVTSTPAAGTVGVLYDGPYGHVAWVEAVHGDGTITISQFNAGWTGDYSVWRVSSTFFQEYIYFGG
jgi:surface antigen/cell division protein FtsB